MIHLQGEIKRLGMDVGAGGCTEVVNDALCYWVCVVDPDGAEGGDEGGVDVRGVGGGQGW